ncbi:MAG: hypothetical protein VXZ68_00855 [Pseudomonadota bacterium]|nr:hypothetical protein [Pseudomonadota bacterium]MEC7787368.1 hypothetical protein [Pseudomonadota bacterium]MEC8108663.1 hypothetical protein [Pseudomonadota bacterium]MEC8168994.1 hypothetical protein [Pseudomonadota bacterium]MEC8377862.1 hypothetical protein [Pseudomonadota bacterium]|tara:strand:+ start:6407 stop:7801 length:1395 start_codon:yes stop_codon:yes gene_type:complete
MKQIKFLLVLFSIFFLSASLLAQETKEREFKFPGYTLDKCLKGYDIAKKSKRMVAKLPSQKAQKYLKRLYPSLEEDNLELALEILNEMKIDDALEDKDKAQMWYYFAYVHFSQDKLREAEKDYFNFLKIEDADPRLKANVIFSLAQISYSKEEYRKAIERMREWLTIEANPSSTGFDIMAAAHWQLNEKKLALKNADTAMCVAKANSSKPRESTYTLLLALYNDAQKTDEMLPLYKELVDFYPKKRYWVQLSSLYGNLNQESNQLSALEAAHDQRLLNKESEYIALYQLLMRAEAPYKAAKALQYGFDEEFVERKEKNLKMLAQGWHMSQELKKAEPLYKEAAEKSEEGELFVFLGQLYLATDRYELAKDSLKLGLEKGKLKDPVTVNILLGQVSYEQQNFDDATIFFRKALDRLTDIQIKDKKKKEEKQDKLREQALTWLSFTEQEAKRVKILEQRKKDLENS